MNSFEKALLRYLPREYLKRAAQVSIALAGCGGIGSNCAQNLVRCGFKRFLLVDHDVVEPSNLNRQFYFSHQMEKPKVEMLKQNLLSINPDLEIQTMQCRLTSLNMADTLQECNVIVEAFDEPVSKKELVETALSLHWDKLIVAVSGIAGTGDADAIVTRKIRDKFYIVGDFKSEVSETLHPYSPGVTIAAAKQADIIFNYFLNCGDDQ